MLPSSSFNAVAALAAHADLTDTAYVASGGDKHEGTGRAALANAMVGHMENPVNRGARVGVFDLKARVRLEYDEQQRPHIIMLGYDLIAFDADEATVANEAFQLIRSSDLAQDAAVAPVEVVADRRALLALHTV